MPKEEGFIHGSDLLLGAMIGEVFTPLGYSKTCSIQNKSTTKERAYKSMEGGGGGKWKDRSVTGLDVTVSAEGFSFYGDTMGYEKLLEIWEAGGTIVLRYAHRGEETTAYREGKFIIDSIEEQAPADDDATYSVSFTNAGQVSTKKTTT